MITYNIIGILFISVMCIIIDAVIVGRTLNSYNPLEMMINIEKLI